MSDHCYLIIHKDFPLYLTRANAGAEMATLYIARQLVKFGRRVIVCACLADVAEGTHDGVEYWDLGDNYDVAGVLNRFPADQPYHLVSTGHAFPILASQDDSRCKSRILISPDRTGNDSGVRAEVLTRLVDRVLCVSAAQREVFIKDGADPDRLLVVHNGVDHERFQAGVPEQRNYHRLVFAGALVQDKGIHLLLEAYANLKAKYSNLELDVYGSADLWGREPFLDTERLAQQLPGVHFHGRVPVEEVAEGYRNAGIAVVPSIWFDPFPLTAVEAQACGCPVVTFDVGGLPEGVVAGETGLVLPEPSVEALQEALDHLLSDQEQLMRMSRRALEIQRPKFDWAHYVEQVIAESEKEVVVELAESDRLPRIGVVTTWNQPCGLATYAKFLFSQFSPEDYFVFAEQHKDADVDVDQSNVVRCWSRESGDFSALREAIRQTNVDLLHLNCHDHNFYKQPEILEFLDWVHELGVEVIAHFHTTYTLTAECNAFLKGVDRAIVHTPENRLQLCANGLDFSKIEVLPHGVLVPDFDRIEVRERVRSTFGLSSGEFLIFSFGFLLPHKGMEAVIEAVKYLRSQQVAVKAVIGGVSMPSHQVSVDYEQALRGLAKSAGCADDVVFTNRFLEEAELLECLAASDLVVMNYRSDYHEASGACSLAVGAGAAVMTSLAPCFGPFGEAVWHMTSGFPAHLSAHLLLANPDLRRVLRENARAYAEKNCWEQVSRQLIDIYKSFKPRRAKPVEEEAVEQNKGVAPNRGQQGKRVLMQTRPHVQELPGGDLRVMERLAEGLRARGVDVVCDHDNRENPSDFDLVHLFNFALPDLLRQQAERAVQVGTPYVVTTLCEDVPRFHNRSQVLAQHLVEYVQRDQDPHWYEKYPVDLEQVPSCQMFDNHWVAENAAALFTSGREESEVVRSYYAKAAQAIPVHFGCELGEPVGAEQFVKEFGVKDFILCVGRFESRKNQLMLLKALEDVELPVVLVGSGFSYQPDYDQAVRGFRRKGQTLILDRLSSEQLRSAYAAARVHALPSWYELPGLVSIEAGWHGCNVVASRTGTTSEYLKDCAFYCEPDSADSIRNSVLAAYYGPRTEKLRERVQRYTWSNMSDRTLEIYQSVWTRAGRSEGYSENLQVPEPEHVDLTAERVASVVVQPVETGPDNDRFFALLKEGEEAAQAKDLERAQNVLKEALELNPTSVRGLRARGAVFFAQGRTAESRDFFEKASKLDPEDPKTLSGLAMCDMSDGNPEAAYERVVKALALAPFEQVTILQLVECSYRLGRFEELEGVLRHYVESAPDDLEMRFCLAGCLYMRDNVSEAGRVVDEVLQSNPDHKGGQELRLKIEERRSQAADEQPVSTSEATETRIIETDDDIVRGPMYNELDDRINELMKMKRKGEIDDTLAGVRELLGEQRLSTAQREKLSLMRADCEVLRGDFAKATELYQEILSANPNASHAICGQGTMAAAQGDWKTAEEYFVKAREVDPQSDVAVAGLGLCNSQAGKGEAAWELYIEALDLNPESTRALLGVIELGYHLNRFDEVENRLKRYLELHPADLDFIYSLAGCCFSQGKLDEASAELEKIFIFNSEHEKARELERMIEEKRTTGSVTVPRS